MLEFYTFVADNYAPFYSTPIECTDRDAAFVLDGLLYNESELARYPSIVLPDFSRLGELADLLVEDHVAGACVHVFAVITASVRSRSRRTQPPPARRSP